VSAPSSPFQLEGGWGVGATLDGTYPLSLFLKERGICPFTSLTKSPSLLYLSPLSDKNHTRAGEATPADQYPGKLSLHKQETVSWLLLFVTTVKKIPEF